MLVSVTFRRLKVMVSDLNVAAGRSDDGRSSPEKMNQTKVPKKNHKAEREKLKRDHENELFLKLGQAVEPTRQNIGKASILGEAAKLLRDLVVQVESLRRENVTLQTESRYVTQEKNELKDETTVLEAEIERLQSEIRERMRSNPAWRSDAIPSMPQQTAILQSQQPPVVGPMYVIPLHRDLQPFPDTVIEPPTAPNSSSHVRRPHARRLTASDSWPHQILSLQLRATELSDIATNTNSNNSNDDNGERTRELQLLDP